MKTICVSAIVILAAASITTASNRNYYLSLSDNALWDQLTNGNKVGQCYIHVSPGRGACYLYAKSAISGGRGDYGWPKAWVDGQRRGTGCVKAPDLPKGVGTCYFSDPRYGLSQGVINSFCSNNGKSNALNQIRHALRNDACGLPKCRRDYLYLPTNELFRILTDGDKIGKCRIQDNTGKPGACNYYAKAGVRGSNGDYGWPKATITGNRKVGTGCVRAPYLSKRVSTCYFRDPRYGLRTYLVNSFCTNDGKLNAVRQIRHALRNGACKLPC